MKPEDVEKIGAQQSKRPPGQHPGNILHQRGSLGLNKYSTLTMAVAGIAIVGAIGWASLLVLKKPEKTPSEVAKTTVGVSDSR
ncbi:hypothetical protein SUGI_0995660 [Cryptomeria japonica]|nr:hypothetical protein SUGI_0995660 [Cryptomeria japonica]